MQPVSSLGACLPGAGFMLAFIAEPAAEVSWLLAVTTGRRFPTGFRHEPDPICTAASFHGHGRTGRRHAGVRSGTSPDADRRISHAEPPGDLRLSALRRHGPGADGRVPGELLRVSLPLYHGHPPRRVEKHSGPFPDEAVLPSGNEHGPGDGGDGRLRQPRAGLHAAEHGIPVRDAFRHRERAGGLPRAVQRDPQHRRNPGPGLVPRAADVRQPAGRLRAASLRRQPAHGGHHRRSASACGPTT